VMGANPLTPAFSWCDGLHAFRSDSIAAAQN